MTTAGVITVDIEGRLGKLDVALKEAERKVEAARKKLDEKSRVDIFGDRFLKKAVGFGAAIQAINLATKAFGEITQRVLVEGQEFGEVWREVSNSFVDSLPIVGGLIRGMGNLAGELFGINQQIRDSRKELRALKQENDLNLKTGPIHQGLNARIGSAQLELRRTGDPRTEADIDAKAGRMAVEEEFQRSMLQAEQFHGQQKQDIIRKAEELRGLQLDNIQKEFDAKIKAIEEAARKEGLARAEAAMEAALAEVEAREREGERLAGLERRMREDHERSIAQDKERITELQQMQDEDRQMERFRFASQSFGSGGIGSFAPGPAAPPNFQKQKVEDELLKTTNSWLEKINNKLPDTPASTTAVFAP